jgi:hypothetical protein
MNAAAAKGGWGSPCAAGNLVDTEDVTAPVEGQKEQQHQGMMSALCITISRHTSTALS